METERAAPEQNVTPWSDRKGRPSKLKVTRKPYNLRSHKYVYKSSTPKSKVDAYVECDLPFDESEIAPELRHEQPREETNSKVP